MKRIPILALCLCVLLVLTACRDTPEPTTVPTTTVPPTTTEPAPDAAAIYADAISLLEAATDITLRVSSEQTMTVGGITYVDTGDQVLRFDGYGTDTMTATAEDHVTYSTFWASYNEVFADGTVYIYTDNSDEEEAALMGKITAADYCSRFIPPMLLDAVLYSDISIDGKTITFSSATAPESWLGIEDAELTEASGSAMLNDEGRIIRYAYELRYTQGPSEFELEFQVYVDTNTDVPAATVPDLPYTELEYPDAARIINIAKARIYQDYTLSTTLQQSILAEAAGYLQHQQINMHSGNPGGSYMGSLTSDLTTVFRNETDTYQTGHKYLNGVYTYTEDGSEPDDYNYVDPDDFYRMIREHLFGGFIWIGAVSEVEAANLGGIYYLKMELAEEYADAVCRQLNNELWGNEEFLNDYADDYRVGTNEAYIAIDSITGFPTAVGFGYAGIYTIEGDEYILSMQSDQTYELASQSAYKAISGENPPTEEPDSKATPLFYHVTGADGQEMWLFGTIHVGDIRTCYLPQKIYDAFDRSDALAVEFDSDKFYEQMDTNKELQQLAAEAYYYTDGSTTIDHIEDEEVYEYALMMLRATGNYNLNALVMKPSMWSNSIENAWLKMGYRLRSEYGMDNLLMERARGQEKEIMDVESGIEQLQMMGGYSDALQEYMLSSTLSTPVLEYQTQVQELYELWCSGNEAALRAYINDEDDEEPDTSTMTEEELDEYNRILELMDEYNSAMSTDRNAEMLNAAIGYLESDQVVFYAVGLAHLLAEDGLVNTLRDAGYTVELVTYP